MSSFSHFYLGFVPRSTQIKEDFIHSLLNLDKMATALDEYEKANGPEKSDINKFRVIRNLPKELEKVILVYNENIAYINKECTEFKEFQWPTFGAYRNTDGGDRGIEEVQQEYNHELAKAQNRHRARREEVVNLGQLGLLFPPLCEKISMVTQRALSQKLPLEKLPELIPLHEVEAKRQLIFESMLRQPNNTLVAQKEEVSTTSTTSSTSSTSAVESQPVVQTPGWIPAVIECSTDKVLGLCHEPWTEKPVQFTCSSSGGNKWQGQIPVDKEFKFVLVQDNNIVRWEEGSNRRHDGSSSLAQFFSIYFH